MVTSDDNLDRTLELVDYRRRVADIYSEVRRRGVDESSWSWWAEARATLLVSHPQSPLDEQRRSTAEPVSYFPYDPSWRVTGTLHPLSSGSAVPSLSEKSSTFTPVGSVRFAREGVQHQLGLFWLEGYGGGLFLPFGDETNGDATYGGGRYLLDGAKSADLGSPGPGQVLLDFNFSYHPSCLWDPIWPCPLAPATNRLAVAVAAGERAPAP